MPARGRARVGGIRGIGSGDGSARQHFNPTGALNTRKLSWCVLFNGQIQLASQLASDDVMRRLLKTLKTLADKLGQPQGEFIEIAA